MRTIISQLVLLSQGFMNIAVPFVSPLIAGRSRRQEGAVIISRLRCTETQGAMLETGRISLPPHCRRAAECAPSGVHVCVAWAEARSRCVACSLQLVRTPQGPTGDREDAICVRVDDCSSSSSASSPNKPRKKCARETRETRERQALRNMR